MTCDKISDIANGIELGENERDTLILGGDIKAGQLIRKRDAVTAELIRAGETNLNMWGVVKNHPAVDLGTDIPSGVAVDIIVSGKFAGFCEDPATGVEAGNLWMAHPAATDGSLCLMATGDFDTDEAVAENIRDIANGCTVGRFRFLK